MGISRQAVWNLLDRMFKARPDLGVFRGGLLTPRKLLSHDPTKTYDIKTKF